MGHVSIPPVLIQNFDNLWNAIFALFQAMSGGVDWNDLAGPLIEMYGFSTGPVFVAYIAFTVLVLLNVITGVFVESASKTIKKEGENELTRRLKSLFVECDEDTSGKMTWGEFRSQLN